MENRQGIRIKTGAEQIMINEITISNLKSIADLKIECRPLNLFVGVNSSGKSTAIQSLLLASQNLDSDIGLNGELVRLGKYEEVHCKFSPAKEPIRISVSNDQAGIVYIFGVKDDREMMRRVQSDDAESIRKFLRYDDRGFQYLSCNRIGPQNTYDESLALNEQIGINGEYAIAFLYKHKRDQLEEEMCKNKGDLTLGGQVNWWLSYITGAQISTSEVPEANIVIATYENASIKNIRPGNIGAGISYVISILVAGLSAREESTLLVENPEIHLHPHAQSKMCEFLYFIAHNDRQVFVETHSDHIFNGFRSGIAQNTMGKDEIAIDFFSLDEESNTTRCVEIEIGQHGRIENQQKNLFDQFDIDLNRMLGL